ncbi:MAG: response regulator [Alphaproteobacteria bacterium]
MIVGSDHSTTDRAEVIGTIGGARVLLVDDNSVSRRIVQLLLEKVSLKVEVADHGLEAAARVQLARFDVVLMDIEMPVMDGYEATRRIRNDPALGDLPIIAMTADESAEHREKSLAAGMNDHLGKPVEPKRLYAALMTWIRRRDGLGVRTTPESRPAPAEHASGLPAALPGIDVAQALWRVDGNVATLRSLFSEFRRDYASAAATLRAALTDHGGADLQSLGILAHSIKGMAGNLSAATLQAAAAALEKAIKARQVEAWPRLLDDFEAALGQVMASIGTLERAEGAALSRTEARHAGPWSLDRDKVIPLLTELSALVDDSNVKALGAFSALKALLSGAAPEIREDVDRLDEHLDGFDFDGARTSLDTLADHLGLSMERKTP